MTSAPPRFTTSTATSSAITLLADLAAIEELVHESRQQLEGLIEATRDDVAELISTTHEELRQAAREARTTSSTLAGLSTSAHEQLQSVSADARELTTR